jgi:hypothetical protein
MMNLKNYTSGIDADTTLARIERLLVSAGATGIQKLYENQQCSAIVFHIQFQPNERPLSVRLPANVGKCQEALWRDYTKSSVRGRKERSDFLEQATRTAWKLVQDWVEVQISLIHLEQVEFLQVFLPYVWDGKQTFFEHVKETGYKALLPELT